MATGGTSTKGGYDCEFISVPPKSLECPICLLTVRQPHVISCCGNQFCQPCIGRIQNDNKPCPLCNDANYTTFFHKGVMREVNSLMVCCPQREIGCDWEGELGQLEEHLNPGASADPGKGCGYVRVECRYKCGETFLRNAIQYYELHHCPMRPVEMQVNSLAKMLTILSNKLDTVMAENQNCKAEIEIIKIKNERENQKQKAEIEALKAENRGLREECSNAVDMVQKHYKAKIENLAVQVDTVQSTCTSLQACIQPVPPFYFTMLNVEHHIQFDYMWRSPPFYSHNGGYKIIVSVFPNVLRIANGLGTHLSLCIAFCPGEYDDKLKWPFSGKIRIEVRDTNFETWVLLQIIDSKTEPLVSRVRPPSDCISNVGLSGQYLSHTQIRASYLKEDRVRFRISRIVFE